MLSHLVIKFAKFLIFKSIFLNNLLKIMFKKNGGYDLKMAHTPNHCFTKASHFLLFFLYSEIQFFIASNYVSSKRTPEKICFYLNTLISKTFLKQSQYHEFSDKGAPTLSNRLHIGVRVWECEFIWVSYFTTGPSYFMTLAEELSENKML